MNINWSELWGTLIGWVTSTGIKILIALVILFVSFRVISVISRKLEKKGKLSEKLDKTVTRTLIYAVGIALKVLVVVCLVGYLGIDTSGLTAVIASLGVCVGLAVNGTLSNLAGGVLILITRPFKLDDYVEVGGYAGTVEEIRITNTKIITVDNKVVYVPNSIAASSTVVNYSEKDTRRVDHTFSIAYGEDFEKAKALIVAIAENHELVLKDPAPFVRVIEHGDSSIKIVTRLWVKGADYWTVYFDVLELVKKAFDENNIEIPFQQLDVHVRND